MLLLPGAVQPWKTFNRLPKSTLTCTEKNRASLHGSAVKQGKPATCPTDYTPFFTVCFLHSPLLHWLQCCCKDQHSFTSAASFLSPVSQFHFLPSSNKQIPREHFPKRCGFCSDPPRAAQVAKEKCQINQSRRLAGCPARQQQAKTVGEVEMMEEGERAVGRPWMTRPKRKFRGAELREEKSLQEERQL